MSASRTLSRRSTPSGQSVLHEVDFGLNHCPPATGGVGQSHDPTRWVGGPQDQILESAPPLQVSDPEPGAEPVEVAGSQDHFVCPLRVGDRLVGCHRAIIPATGRSQAPWVR